MDSISRPVNGFRAPEKPWNSLGPRQGLRDRRPPIIASRREEASMTNRHDGAIERVPRGATPPRRAHGPSGEASAPLARPAHAGVDHLGSPDAAGPRRHGRLWRALRGERPAPVAAAPGQRGPRRQLARRQPRRNPRSLPARRAAALRLLRRSPRGRLRRAVRAGRTRAVGPHEPPRGGGRSLRPTSCWRSKPISRPTRSAASRSPGARSAGRSCGSCWPSSTGSSSSSPGWPWARRRGSSSTSWAWAPPRPSASSPSWPESGEPGRWCARKAGPRPSGANPPSHVLGGRPPRVEGEALSLV